jgi:hypothetical protein
MKQLHICIRFALLSKFITDLESQTFFLFEWDSTDKQRKGLKWFWWRHQSEFMFRLVYMEIFIDMWIYQASIHSAKRADKTSGASSTPRTQNLVSNTVFQEKELRILGEMSDSTRLEWEMYNTTLRILQC